jgi:hypothetical protein
MISKTNLLIIGIRPEGTLPERNEEKERSAVRPPVSTVSDRKVFALGIVPGLPGVGKALAERGKLHGEWRLQFESPNGLVCWRICWFSGVVNHSVPLCIVAL